MTRHCLVTLTEGRLVRDLLENGLLDLLAEGGLRVTVATPADRVPHFTARWGRKEVSFMHLHEVNENRWLSRAIKFRKRLVASRCPRILLEPWLTLERRRFVSQRAEYERLFAHDRPDLVLTTNATPPAESELVAAAYRHGVQTLGVVGSWDRLHKFLYTRTRHLSVWNELNRQEAKTLEGYEPQYVHVTGPAQFDAYFGKDAVRSREATCADAGLDPSRPYLMLATSGSFLPNYDETHLLRWLVEQIDTGALPQNMQILCRLHPFSRLEHFLPYAQNGHLRISHMGYLPTLGASMTREEVVSFGNLVRHAALVITPGSTLTIEAAIFDTPTVVPIFHTYQAEMCERYYRTRVFGRHFERIRKLNLVPIVQGSQQLLGVLRRYLREPVWFQQGRQRLVEDYVQFTDGKSTRRLADLALRLCTQSGVREEPLAVAR